MGIDLPLNVSSIKSTGSTTARSLPVRFGDTIEAADYGLGDGVTPDATALNAAGVAAVTAGKTLIVRPGNYSLDAGWSIINVTGNFEVICEEGAKFTAAAGFPGGSTKLLQIQDGADARIVWRGGFFDGTNIPNSGVGEANDTVSFNLAGARELICEDMEIVCGTDFVVGGSDSGLFAAWATQMTFNRIKVTGAPDVGMYLSGGSADNELTEQLKFDELSFYGCHNGLAVKRRFRRISGNRIFCTDCSSGLVLGAEADVGVVSLDLQADDIQIAALNTRRVSNSLTLRWAQNAHIGSVIARDLGCKITSGGGFEDTSAVVVLLQGAQRCHVGTIIGDTENADIASLTSRGVRASGWTVNSVLRNCTDNYLGPIILNGIDTAVIEDDSSQDRNTYEVHPGGFSKGPSLLGGGSYVKDAYRLIDAIASLGLLSSLQLCLDAGDANSYTSGQSWLDRSGNGYDFFFGLDGSASTDDPTFNGTVGGRSRAEYFLFDGGDYFTYDSANETWMDALHKDNAAFTVLGYFYPGSTGSAAILGSTGASATANGILLNSSSGGQLQLTVNNGTGTALSVASGANGDLAPAVWNFFGASINEATGSNGLSLYSRNKITTATSTYTTPSAGAAAQTLQIAARGGGSLPLVASSRLGCICIWSRALSAAEVAAFKQVTRRRYAV